MPADPMRARALACLREGRVTVWRVVTPPDVWRITGVLARVRSSRDQHPYRVELRDDRWSCDCRDGRRDDRCPHVAAVALVTTAGAAQ